MDLDILLSESRSCFGFIVMVRLFNTKELNQIFMVTPYKIFLFEILVYIHVYIVQIYASCCI